MSTLFIGNALVDHEYKVSESELQQMAFPKGHMTLVDHDTLSQLKASSERLYSHQQSSMGGSSANTAYLCQQLGMDSQFVGTVGHDKAGQQFREALDTVGIKHNLQKVTNTFQTGECVVFMTPDGERTMVTFLGATQNLSDNEISSNVLQGVDTLYIEGYLAAQPRASQAVHVLIKQAKFQGIRVVVSLSDPSIVTDCREALLGWFEHRIDLIFGNIEEALTISRSDELKDAVSILSKWSDRCIITKGKAGSVLFDGAKCINIKASPVKSVDTLGAGDAFAAGWLYANHQSVGFASAAEFATLVAGSVVSQMGARLPDSEIKRLKHVFEKFI